MKAILVPRPIVLPLPARAAEKHDEAEKQAVAAAESWLALVDDGKYGESWDAAAEYLKNAVTKDDFAKSLNAARKPLGKLKSREIKSKECRTSLPGAPDGQYVVIQFKTVVREQEVGHRDGDADAGQGQEVAGERVLHQVSQERRSNRPMEPKTLIDNYLDGPQLLRKAVAGMSQEQLLPVPSPANGPRWRSSAIWLTSRSSVPTGSSG